MTKTYRQKQVHEVGARLVKAILSTTDECHSFVLLGSVRVYQKAYRLLCVLLRVVHLQLHQRVICNVMPCCTLHSGASITQYNKKTIWLSDIWLTDWLIDWLTYWLTDTSINLLTDWFSTKSTNQQHFFAILVLTLQPASDKPDGTDQRLTELQHQETRVQLRLQSSLSVSAAFTTGNKSRGNIAESNFYPPKRREGLQACQMQRPAIFHHGHRSTLKMAQPSLEKSRTRRRRSKGNERCRI